MRIILVDDEVQVLKGVSRIISCEEDEWEVETALSGESALEILELEKFDVVVSDMRMPGMDGAQLLDEIERLYPSMLRVVLSGQADRETVLRAVKPMHQFLSKPCDSDQLFKVIKRAQIFQETIKSAVVLDAIGRANCLPAFPEIVNDINREVESADGNCKSIANIVSKDPILSARLLQLANSAIFGQCNPVTDISRAVSLVGLEMIRALAMSQAVYSGNEMKGHVISAQSLFDHGFQTAVAAKKIAKNAGLNLDDGNTVFSSGLLHDVGKLILLNAFPEKYEGIVKSALEQNRDIQDLEMETFGATHQGIGGYLFELWGLPGEVTESVAAHHSFIECARAAGKPQQIVFAANWICRNRDAELLQRLVDESEEKTITQRFANQIIEWSEYLSNLEDEV